uniref:Nuclear pore complex protein Nup85 n=1 Tax=Plectus sambesii TaxID=2011161 RepID=A0A914VTR9_9BILA
MNSNSIALAGNHESMVVSLSKISQLKPQKTGAHVGSFELVPLTQTRFSNPSVRRLIIESHGIFVNLQAQTKASVQEQLGADELVSFSRQYRSVLRSACLSLQETAQGPSEDIALLCDIYRGGELVWSLVELLFIQPQGGSVAVDLVDWAQLNFTQADEYTCEILKAAESGFRPDQQPQYWNAAWLFVLSGRCEDARRLLLSHSRKDDAAFRSIDELLKKFPLDALNRDDVSAFSDWQEEVGSRLRNQHFASYPQLETIAKILAGNDAAWSDLRDVIDSWHEAFVGLALYFHPKLRVVELGEVAEEALRLFPVSNGSLSSLDQTLLALLEMDVLEALRSLSSCSADWWLVSHLTDLLIKAGAQLGPTGDEATQVDLREFLLLEYGSSLMAHDSLWQIGADYLSWCPRNGRAYLEAFFDKIPVDREHKALKLMSACAKYQLDAVATSVARQMTVKLLSAGRINIALGWCLQAKDPALVSFVVERALLEYGQSGLLGSLHLLEHLGDNAFISPALIFLQKYHEFHSLLKAGELLKAGQLLTDLIVSKVAPRKFWKVLFADALLLLDPSDGQVIIDKEATYQLIELLQSVTTEVTALRSNAFVDSDADRNEFSEQMTAFRLALFRNLGKAVCLS